MSTRNGSVLGATKIVDHGMDPIRYTIALMSEGYTADQMPRWEADAQSFADFLFTQAPFCEMRCAINIYRVDVISDESGADDPNCGDEGGGTTVKTYFDATFCASPGVRRAMDFDSDTALDVLMTHVPMWRVGLVIVNSFVEGGTGGTIPIVSSARSSFTDWRASAVHELGHSAFGLADEYDYYASATEEGHDVHDGIEPVEPNVTSHIFPVPGVTKWSSLIVPGTPIPTKENHSINCSNIDVETWSGDPDVVGAFEGAHYFHCGAWRPQFSCRMRLSDQPFCAVCEQAIRDTLAPFDQPFTIVPLTTSVAFPDVEAGTTVPGHIAFTVSTCLDVSFRVVDGPRRLDGGPEESNGAPVLALPYGVSTLSESTPDGMPRTAYVWLTYQAGNPGDVLRGTITVECTKLDFGTACPTPALPYRFEITGNTVAPVNVGVALCLDQSSSMAEPAAGGGTKGEALQDAAGIFVDVMQAKDGIGVIKFATDAAGGAITDAGDGLFGAGRILAREDIDSYVPDPQGLTAIGDAVEEADALLKAAGSRYDQTAMVIFTDGKETTEKFISDVDDLISSNTKIFAVGLGSAANLDAATLDILCGGSGGRLLLTGDDYLDTQFLLAKYFLNILAGATNTEIVYDPEGYLAPDAGVVRVPFGLNETDTSADAILITPIPSAVDFALETPAGDVITQLVRPPGTSFLQDVSTAYYRVSLPALLHGKLLRDGTWHALLKLDMDAWKAGDNFPALFWYLQQHPSAVANGLPYSMHFQARSNLKLTAQCLQDSYEPGAELRVRGILTEYGLPVDGRASVRAELTRPDGTMATLPMPEIEPGVFEAVEIGRQTGVYPVRVLAAGATLRDYPFTREQLVTGFTYHRGDIPTTHPVDEGGKWCDMLRCLLGVLTPEVLERLGIDWRKLRDCIDKRCGSNGITATTATGTVDIDPRDVDLVRDAAIKLGLLRATGTRPVRSTRR